MPLESNVWQLTLLRGPPLRIPCGLVSNTCCVIVGQCCLMNDRIALSGRTNSTIFIGYLVEANDLRIAGVSSQFPRYILTAIRGRPVNRMIPLDGKRKGQDTSAADTGGSIPHTSVRESDTISAST